MTAPVHKPESPISEAAMDQEPVVEQGTPSRCHRGKGPLAALSLGLSIGAGLMMLGFLLAGAIGDFRAADRYVEVKGLSERDAEADRALWPLTHKVVARDMAQLSTRLRERNKILTDFLKGSGFEDAEIIVSPPSIVDAQAEGWQNQGPDSRFKATARITVRSNKIKFVLDAKNRLGDLIQKGVVLAGEEYGNTSEFLFTKLNDMKPSMIEEATKNARAAADKFAQDSGSRVGRIRHASQGLFTIDTPDTSAPHVKKLRVVTTVQFFLES